MKKPLIPTTEPALRIAALFRRRVTTAWSEKEVRKYKALVKSKCFETMDDLALIERYYAFERKKGERGLHRRDLYTFVNNYQGELDRATAWAETHPVRPLPRKIIPIELPSEPYVPPTDPESIARYERFMEEYRARKKVPKTFADVREIMKG